MFYLTLTMEELVLRLFSDSGMFYFYLLSGRRTWFHLLPRVCQFSPEDLVVSRTSQISSGGLNAAKRCSECVLFFYNRHFSGGGCNYTAAKRQVQTERPASAGLTTLSFLSLGVRPGSRP